MMRDLRTLDGYRRRDPFIIKYYGDVGDETCGVFMLPSPVAGELMVIASSGEGWDHVSVSAQSRCPTWTEMEHIRRRFFQDHEAVMQYHAPVADYVDGSQHGCEHCLHLWRPQDAVIPAPPKWMVGGMTWEAAETQQWGGS